jgi:hypothetical protein
MSFVGEKYKHDIFVSYSHGTPAHGENETDLKRWTHAFVRKLEEDIRYSVQAQDPTWRSGTTSISKATNI